MLLKQALIISTFSLIFTVAFGAAFGQGALTLAELKSMPRTALRWDNVRKIIPVIDKKYLTGTSPARLRSDAQSTTPHDFELVFSGVYVAAFFDGPEHYELFGVPIYQSKTNPFILSINRHRAPVFRDPNYPIGERFFILIGGVPPLALEYNHTCGQLNLLESFPKALCQHEKSATAPACDHCILFRQRGRKVCQLPAASVEICP